jgi:eukaryotic-like serine/threonine-protein kinase
VPDPDRLPARLPTHLVLTGPLGAGGSGEVWAARDRRAGRDVAVKFVRFGPGGTGPGRLEREARALARLGAHPGVVTLLEVGHDGRSWGWLVSELVDGSPWSVLVGRGGAGAARAAPSWDRVASAAGAVASALAAAHDVGVVHGDVTPANVIDAPGRGPVLVDFGLAELGDPEAPDTDEGRRGSIPAMTPAYAAPERRRGRPPRPAGDLYGLGATVLAVVTGGAPDPLAVRVRVPGTVPFPLAEVIADLLDVDPRRRPSARSATTRFSDAVEALRPRRR